MISVQISTPGLHVFSLNISHILWFRGFSYFRWCLHSVLFNWASLFGHSFISWSNTATSWDLLPRSYFILSNLMAKGVLNVDSPDPLTIISGKQRHHTSLLHFSPLPSHCQFPSHKRREVSRNGWANFENLWIGMGLSTLCSPCGGVVWHL